MRFTDQLLLCPDCLFLFRFSASSQRTSAELGYEPPRLCKNCRVSLEASRR